MPLTNPHPEARPKPENGSAVSVETIARPRALDAQRHRVRKAARRQNAADGIAAATLELASQTAETAAAARQLSASMQEISAGALEASTACQESLAVMGSLGEQIGVQRVATQETEELATTLQQLLLASKSALGDMVASVSAAAARQMDSVTRIADLERQADEIGEIVQVVSDIADETNLLAINAAIEAARAREHGKGFAVVADEVRALAETSERSARDIRELIDAVRTGVGTVAGSVRTSFDTAQGEMTKGDAIAEQLEGFASAVEDVVASASEVSASAIQSERSALEIRRMTEEIAAAAEEQSNSLAQALDMVGEQGTALSQSERAAEELSEIAEELRSTEDDGESADEVAAAADELSAAVEEINRSATQIVLALQETAQGGRLQAARTEQAAAAIAQISHASDISRNRAERSEEQVDGMILMLASTREAVAAMVDSIAAAANDSLESVEQVRALDDVSRRIDKIVDAIATVAMQTNMLAISGSVESARAGEYGRGFAAVSADIRKLAKDSAENADRIKSLVREVQDRIRAVRGDLYETSQLALSEVARARVTTDRLAEIQRDVGTLGSNSEKVKLAAEQIASGLLEVQQGMDSIAAAARQSEEVSATATVTARSQSTAAEELAAAVEEIAALASELQSA